MIIKVRRFACIQNSTYTYVCIFTTANHRPYTQLKLLFVSFEPERCFCVLFMMLLYTYDVFFLGIFNIYVVFHLNEKNLL